MQQQRQAQPSELSAESGEVACPLCKSVANGILPYHIPLLTSDCSSSASIQLPINSKTIDSELFLDWSSPESSDIFPAYDILVADHCLSRSQLQSEQRLVMRSSGAIGKNITSLRQLQALWAAIGYSLLSAVCNPITPTAALVQDMSKTAMVAVDQLFRCAQRARSWLSSAEFNYEEVVLAPLRRLLFVGQHFSTTFPSKCFLQELKLDEITQFLSLQPLPVVFDSICPEDSETLQTAFGIVQSHEHSPTKSMWPFLLQPLLSQDLHVIAVAITSNSHSVTESLHLISLLCLARLCQILLEPVGTGRFVEVCHSEDASTSAVGKKRSRFPSDSIDCSFREGELDLLRDRLCEAAGVTWQGSIDGSLVQDSWVPFLKFSCFLRNLLSHQASLSEPSIAAQGRSNFVISGEDRPFIFQLLHETGLGELVRGVAAESEIVLEGALLEKLSALWGNQYQAYYQHSVAPIETSLPPTTPAQDHPQETAVEAKTAPSEEDVEDMESSEEEDSEDGESESDEEGDSIGEDDIMGFDVALRELANDPALLLPNGQGVDLLEMQDWLRQTGDLESEELLRLLGSLDRNQTKGSMLCGVDPVETPFRRSLTSLDTIPPLVGSVSGVTPFFDSSQHLRLSTLLFDNSHLGLGQRHPVKLFALPQKYTDLYQMVTPHSPPRLIFTQSKFPAFLGGAKPIDNPAVCLVCGQILSAGLTPLSLDSHLLREPPGHDLPCLPLGPWGVHSPCHRMWRWSRNVLSRGEVPDDPPLRTPGGVLPVSLS